MCGGEAGDSSLRILVCFSQLKRIKDISRTDAPLSHLVQDELREGAKERRVRREELICREENVEKMGLGERNKREREMEAEKQEAVTESG